MRAKNRLQLLSTAIHHEELKSSLTSHEEVYSVQEEGARAQWNHTKDKGTIHHEATREAPSGFPILGALSDCQRRRFLSGHSPPCCNAQTRNCILNRFPSPFRRAFEPWLRMKCTAALPFQLSHWSRLRQLPRSKQHLVSFSSFLTSTIFFV